ncbi:MAG: hypothetical protein N2C14_15410 [Planctomycetales bacterium]
MLAVWLIGDARPREFRSCVDLLANRARLTRFSHPRDAAEFAQNQAPPDVIVALQGFPGEFSDADLRPLRDAAPLARVIGVLGSWCEGEMRTGEPWPAARRLYWHHATARLSADLDAADSGGLPIWGLPVTSTHEDELLLSAGATRPQSSGLIAVCSLNGDMTDWLRRACELRGFSSAAWRDDSPVQLTGAAAGVWDAASCDAWEAEQLRRFARELAPAPIIALLDFPRWEDRQRALAHGAAEIVSKPLLLDDLYFAIDQASAQPRDGQSITVA